ncbi:hypothetical protein [Yinghuangia soli]|uniref:Uncharacterized protein n=1 Tax=Yinghuangia soli TaxID=2908204 RepID=A0AA41Q1U0_9ACTN|nr:hypothetical protein [Yinghuangia soli]MCF2530018.1 hypothetical protein [Yinghuangia soli]
MISLRLARKLGILAAALLVALLLLPVVPGADNIAMAATGLTFLGLGAVAIAVAAGKRRKCEGWHRN